MPVNLERYKKFKLNAEKINSKQQKNFHTTNPVKLSEADFRRCERFSNQGAHLKSHSRTSG